MASFSGFFGGLGSLFSSAVAAAGRFLNSLFQTELAIADNVSKIVTDFEETKSNIQAEIQKLRDFEFNPRWKSRVINVPVAIDQTKSLVQKVIDTFSGKLEQIKQPIHDLNLIFKGEAAPDPLGDKPAAIAKAAVKVDEIATMIASLAKAMDDVKDMSALVKDVTDSIEGLDTLFLSQGRPQKKVAKLGRFRYTP